MNFVLFFRVKSFKQTDAFVNQIHVCLGLRNPFGARKRCTHLCLANANKNHYNLRSHKKAAAQQQKSKNYAMCFDYANLCRLLFEMIFFSKIQWVMKRRKKSWIKGYLLESVVASITCWNPLAQKHSKKKCGAPSLLPTNHYGDAEQKKKAAAVDVLLNKIEK